MDSEINPHVEIMGMFISDLFILGVDDDSTVFNLHRLVLTGDYDGYEGCKDEAKKIIDGIADSFNHYANPTEMLLRYLGIDFNEISDPLLVHRSIDKRGHKILPDSKICERGHDIINSAFVMHSLGLKENADRLTRAGMKIIINDAFKKEFDNLNKEAAIKNGLSDLNKKKASKPRNPYYGEVMSVIKCTWEKYPCASKTGLIDKLSFHYHGKVSKNTVSNWVNKSGMQPDRPKKYSSFELVFPQ